MDFRLWTLDLNLDCDNTATQRESDCWGDQIFILTKDENFLVNFFNLLCQHNTRSSATGNEFKTENIFSQHCQGCHEWSETSPAPPGVTSLVISPAECEAELGELVTGTRRLQHLIVTAVRWDLLWLSNIKLVVVG